MDKVTDREEEEEVEEVNRRNSEGMGTMEVGVY